MLLEVENLVKEYKKGFKANNGINLSIERGEVFGLLGPNGAGKSTLVEQIVGLLTPTSGKIVLNGNDISKNPGYARKVASFQPQSDVPIEGLTVRQAIDLIGKIRGGTSNAVGLRTSELIQQLEISEWEDKQGQQLSGGVKRLVGYCMAAIVPGDLVILDEPTNDVDPLRRRLLWQQIRILADKGSAVLLVTHNVLEAERAVDRLAIIDKGRILTMGTPGSMKNNGASSLRLEIILVPTAERPEIPEFIKLGSSGRRLRATVLRSQLQAAVEWAEWLQTAGVAEEFSLSPISLEDVYVKTIGRPEILENSYN